MAAGIGLCTTGNNCGIGRSGNDPLLPQSLAALPAIIHAGRAGDFTNGGVPSLIMQGPHKLSVMQKATPDDFPGLVVSSAIFSGFFSRGSFAENALALDSASMLLGTLFQRSRLARAFRSTFGLASSLLAVLSSEVLAFAFAD